MLFVITPLYVIGMVQSIAFTIYFSPSVNITSATEKEDLTLAGDVISNFIYALISAIVLVLGLKNEYWRVPGESLFDSVRWLIKLSGFEEQVVALANLGAAPAGRYLELDDTRSTK